MKAVTVKQPWAGLIMSGMKDIENRTWATQHRGKLLIHSTKTLNYAEEKRAEDFIVKKILTLLNNRLAIYLNKLEANCRCSFNEYFEEVILDDKGHDCCYYNFSGGERKRIDLAMLFAFQDIRRLQGDVSINLSMYDELLDSSLDGKGIECVLNTLYERVENYDEAIYIITHNPLTMNITISSTINLVKSNGITKLAS